MTIPKLEQDLNITVRALNFGDKSENYPYLLGHERDAAELSEDVLNRRWKQFLTVERQAYEFGEDHAFGKRFSRLFLNIYKRISVIFRSSFRTIRFASRMKFDDCVR